MPGFSWKAGRRRALPPSSMPSAPRPSVGDYTLNLSTVDTITIKINASGKAGVLGVNSGLWLLPK